MGVQVNEERDERVPLSQVMDDNAQVLYWEVFVSPNLASIWDEENRVQWIKNKDSSSERYAVRVATDRTASNPDKIVSIRATRSDGFTWEKWRYYPNEVSE